MIADHLQQIIDKYRPGHDLFEVGKALTLAHSEHLDALGPVRVMALDPCPRCGGHVIASDAVARCTRCDHTVGGGIRMEATTA